MPKRIEQYVECTTPCRICGSWPRWDSLVDPLHADAGENTFPKFLKQLLNNKKFKPNNQRDGVLLVPQCSDPQKVLHQRVAFGSVSVGSLGPRARIRRMRGATLECDVKTGL